MNGDAKLRLSTSSTYEESGDSANARSMYSSMSSDGMFISFSPRALRAPSNLNMVSMLRGPETIPDAMAVLYYMVRVDRLSEAESCDLVPYRSSSEMKRTIPSCDGFS